jgi:hypothetical protein
MLNNCSNLGPLSRSILLIAALAFGGTMAGCADIHPEGDDPEAGMLDAPTDEAVQERETFERETEHGGEAEGRR